ncbi:unnamed protein product [Rhizoctonia solani]|uniref:Uncharacterized protein n=1 Tax=Rhizoctonia solani TaxID=456999 RepID=A0A8H3HA60_9AGAM|nr:unnamed protein product [Rhizoctonia solani]
MVDGPTRGLLPPYDHRISEDEWDLYFRERTALDELNTFGSDASASIQPGELRPPLRVLEDSAADIAAAMYGSVLVEESKIAIARTLRGSLYITSATGMEGWQVDLNPSKDSSLTVLNPVSPYDYRESDYFGLLVAKSNKVGDIDAESPRKCKALAEDGSPQPGSVEIFSWHGGNTVGAVTAAKLSSFEPTLFGSTGWLSPLKLHNLLLAASTCSQYDDCYQELEPGIAVASSKNLKFFAGETTGGEFSEAEMALYKRLRKDMLSGNAKGDVDEDDQPGCVPDRLLLLARHK